MSPYPKSSINIKTKLGFSIEEMFCNVLSSEQLRRHNDKIESKCKWSPFHGVEVKGFPVITIVNGEIKMKNGKIIGKPGGKLLKF